MYLNGKVASVDIVSQEEVACVLRGSPHVKQLHEVIELSVDVTTHCDWCIHH